ncbi:MAG: hypothetical protein O3A87_03205 [Verrucomicrobia bacterium]|nr:hypothetical protein [Verrucomicrobiota bacterium]MDA1005471.1 hypothetical protein [Verrucomicrobiota bacterium]
MILKGLFGKIRRFVRGRRLAGRDGEEDGVPSSCLHRYPVEGDDSELLAIFYSGDGGWANLTTHLSKRLQEAGIPVVGIDCMHYFWREKRPVEAAGELEILLGKEKAKRVILLGYSMGADVLPLIATSLSDEALGRVASVVLMSPSDRGYLKFRFIGWLGVHTHPHLGSPLLPDVEKLARTLRVSCFAGEREERTLARSLGEDLARVELLPGGRHYGSDYERLADRVLAHLEEGGAGSC